MIVGDQIVVLCVLLCGGICVCLCVCERETKVRGIKAARPAHLSLHRLPQGAAHFQGLGWGNTKQNKTSAGAGPQDLALIGMVVPPKSGLPGVY